MTQEEAIRLLEQELEGFRREPYPGLVHWIDGGSQAQLVNTAVFV